jgi:two-component system, LytTR family, sensor histidine kinase AlgZ
MKDLQILSAFADLPASGAAEPARALVFDACHVGVILRAVLFVEAVVGVAAMFVADGFMPWLARVSVLSGAALPAVLVWLLAGCSLKRWLARLSLALQQAFGVLLGAFAGLYGCGMLVLVGPDAPEGAPWVASAFTGALLAAALVAGLVWRAKGRMPADTTARLAELQARIRPHFLFNTLNTAVALVREDPARAETVLEDLADLFRHALADPGESVTLSEEVALARRYLDIEQVRFGERLRVEWALDPMAGGAKVPPLVLQPLVENAVKHGVEPSADGAQVRISTERRSGTVVIKVANTVPAGQGRPGHGVAQDNVRDRLQLLHDVRGQFQSHFADGIYRVRLEVPG